MWLHKMGDSIRFNDSVLKFPGIDKGDPAWDAYINFDPARGGVTFIGDDRVNSPSHYTNGSQEAIDIIEDAISDAPSNKQGFLQAQVLKYLLRLWLKDNPKEDAEKARWYLNRLIDSL